MIKRGNFRLAILPDQSGENIVLSRFVLVLKYSTTGEVRERARFVIGGHRDKVKHRMIRTASTLSHTFFLRLVLALVSIFGFDVFSEDVRQAYLQSASNPQQTIFVEPNELELGHDELLQRTLPLYGPSESGEFWDRTSTERCLRSTNLSSSPATSYLFSRRTGHEICALSDSYVDDIIRVSL